LDPAEQDPAVSSIVSDVVFAAPSGRRHALVMFSGAIAFLCLYVYYGLLGEADSIAGLFLLFGCVLSGIAESLPTDQRRLAGVLRIAAVMLLLCLLVALGVAPEFVLGAR
jgi:hypothetical protein